MRRYRFDAATGQRRTDYGSHGFTLVRLLDHAGPLTVNAIYLAAAGRLAFHPAAADQLFLVVAGAGEVRGSTGPFQSIRAGQAAFWSAGEEHETRTESGLAAIVLEGPGLAPLRAGLAPD